MTTYKFSDAIVTIDGKEYTSIKNVTVKAAKVEYEPVPDAIAQSFALAGIPITPAEWANRKQRGWTGVE